MKNRYFIKLTYRGTVYHGWQKQPGSLSVQEVVEEALSVILRETLPLTGAGRTDTGVHSTCYYAHFDSTHRDLDTQKNLVKRLNRFLPRDIAISEIKKVKQEAHARFSALSRTYRYYIITRKDPFRTDFAWLIDYTPEIGLMNEACTILKEYNDFTSFARLHSNAKTNLCRIYEAYCSSEEDSEIIFTITADRFLRNMVRAIAGTLVDVGRGKTSPEEFRRIIEGRNRGMAGKSAPACGLFLTDIRYPEEIFI